MHVFEIFYIFDSRRMSNPDYIPRRDQQLPLAFGNLLKCGYNNKYMLYELKTGTYFDVVTYVLFIENINMTLRKKILFIILHLNYIQAFLTDYNV